MLDVVIIKPMTKLDLVRTYPKLFTGGHTKHPQYEHHRVKSVTVAAPGVVAYADGERLGALPLTVDVVPLALRVLAPR
jgi:diacylglycerol kinase (ATP)